MSERDFKLLAKDPDSHRGEAYKIYGVVTQFDSATGTSAFRANTGPTELDPSVAYKFEQNTMLDGTSTLLANLVKDDLFVANIEVVGSLTYDTQSGGKTTVPRFRVREITVYGSR